MPTLRIMLVKLLLMLSTALFADHHQNSSYQFLNTIYSPRLVALGGSYPSLHGNMTAILINPAGAAFIRDRQVSAIYVNHLLDLKGGFAGIAFPISDLGSVNAGILYFDHGSFEEIDRFASATGRNFQARDLAFMTTFSNYLSDHFAYGVTLKYIYSEIDRYSASAFAADLGILTRVSIWGAWDFGISLRNLGKSIDAYHQVKEPLPTTLGVGFSQTIASTPISVHAAFNNLWNRRDGLVNNLYDFSFGLEVPVAEQLTLRMGYNNNLHFNIETPDDNKLAGFSTGFALNLGVHQLDYGYVNNNHLGATHHFGLKLIIGQSSDRDDSREEIDISDVEDLVPPRNVFLATGSEKVRITWENIKGASYNIYVRLLEASEWTIINKFPLQKNYISLKKPRYAGTYMFTITTISGLQESAYSEAIILKID